MKQISDSSPQTTATIAAQLIAARMVPEHDPLLNGTPARDFAPTLSSGCISDVSSDAIHGYEHDYALAMKSYATVYENFQAYLEPANILATHDYDLSTRPVPEHERLGCLDQEFMEYAGNNESISDEDIESCGYLGWLRH
ncbi:MAG TPA: hypothetical protein VLC91_16380 [Spongiibacteraceae bacterium]|nr:hypothetical protein [Spongiibacteraceae bacterium]